MISTINFLVIAVLGVLITSWYIRSRFKARLDEFPVSQLQEAIQEAFEVYIGEHSYEQIRAKIDNADFIHEFPKWLTKKYGVRFPAEVLFRQLNAELKFKSEGDTFVLVNRRDVLSQTTEQFIKDIWSAYNKFRIADTVSYILYWAFFGVILLKSFEIIESLNLE